MIVAKAISIPVECVAQGYVAGSASQEYDEWGTAQGIPMPSGLRENEELDHPLLTPTAKSEMRQDPLLTAQDVEEMGLVGLLPELESKSLPLHQYARKYALSPGIIIADAKLELGFLGSKLILIDELLTPDSGRFLRCYTVRSWSP
jgi:phosphoribosylaminoimidazole-succinocarboxamide synthase